MENENRKSEESMESEHVSGGEASGNRGLRDAWRGGTPEDVKRETKSLVEKGVAAIAGAIKGFADRSEQEHLPDKAREAVHQLGETTKAVASETESQISSVGEQARHLGETVKSQAHALRDQAREVKDEVRGTPTGGMSGSAYSSMGDVAPDLGSSAASPPSFGMGGSQMEPSPSLSGEGPTDEGLESAKGLPEPGKEKKSGGI